MCGIAGIINHHNSADAEALIVKMSNAIIHRGPDDSGHYIDEHVALGHRRLSIIDLSNGHQPLTNEDGTVFIVFNGEIYNHEDLRPQLGRQGHQFRTNCDTEVIVHLYEQYGDDCVNYLNGMFAFCIYDTRQNKILLARDRMGQKPLFYFKVGNTLAFASELNSLKQHPSMPREYNMQAIHDYLSLQYIPCPFTIYQTVFKLPPAHTLTMDMTSGNIEIQQYWKLDFSKKTTLSFEEATKQLRSLMNLSVLRRLMSDVPYGAFLSGGLDSSIITGIMSRICEQPVKTFTIGFDEKMYDERNFAARAARAINGQANFPMECRVKTVNPQDFDILKMLIKHYGEPYSDASMLPTFLLSKFTREYVTVALSGDGADELFAGYERYLVMKYTGFSDLIPMPLRRLLFAVPAAMLPDRGERTLTGRMRRTLRTAASPSEKRYLDIISRFNEQLKNKVYGARFADMSLLPSYEVISSVYDAASARKRVEKIMETDIQTYLPGDILTKVDIASMACSLEVRSPFMDHEVVEFAASLPLKYKQAGISRKHILKEAFKDIIPTEIRDRRKKGFGVPIASWFRGPWQGILKEHLLSGILVKQDFFKKQAFEQLIDNHCSGQADNSYPLWSLLILELFMQNDLEK